MPNGLIPAWVEGGSLVTYTEELKAAILLAATTGEGDVIPVSNSSKMVLVRLGTPEFDRRKGKALIFPLPEQVVGGEHFCLCTS